jgi:hypothetical protein
VGGLVALFQIFLGVHESPVLLLHVLAKFFRGVVLSDGRERA